MNTQHLDELLKRQVEQTNSWAKAVSEIQKDDMVLKLQNLEKKLAQLQAETENAKQKSAMATRENTQLKEALYEQMSAQKQNLLKQSKHNLDIYFGHLEKENENALRHLEQEIHLQSRHIQEAVASTDKLFQTGILAELSKIKNIVNHHAQHSKETLQSELAQKKQQAEKAYEALAKKPLTPEAISEKMKANSKELKFGTKIMNIIGVFLIVLGVIFAMQYAYTLFITTPEAKTVLAFMLGLMFLCAGEWMNKRERNSFSLGITAGGIGILLAAVTISHFILLSIGMYPALLICVAITVVALFLSLRYHSQLIAIFALIGGYLPIVSDLDGVLLFGALPYFFFLNLFVLLIASSRGWRILRFFSLFCNVLGTFYLLQMGADIPPAYGLLHVFLNFLLYTSMTVIYPIRKKEPLLPVDTVFLGLNAWFGITSFFALLYFHQLGKYDGLFIIVIAAIFFGFHRLLRKKLEEDAKSSHMFYVFSLIFVFAFSLFQLEPRFFLLGFALETLLFFAIGIFLSKAYKKTNIAFACLIYTVSLFIFFPQISITFAMNAWFQWAFFWQYGLVLAISIAILAMVLLRYKKDLFFWTQSAGVVTNFFKYLVIVNTWIFTLYLVFGLAHYFPLLIWQGPLWFLCLFATLFYARLLRNIPILFDFVVEKITYVWFGLVVFFGVLFNTISFEGHHGFAQYTLLLLANLLTFYAIYELCRTLRNKNHMNQEGFHLSLSLFSLGLFLEILFVQQGASLENMLVSFVLLGASFAFVFFGFQKSYAYMRRVGLGLSLLSITKLFLIDLSFLRSGQRIVSYFVFGAIFIAISYLYQYFSKRYLNLGKIDIPIPKTQSNEMPVRETQNNETPISKTQVNETSVSETQVNKTQVNETQVNETQVNETQVNETQVNETQVNETQDPSPNKHSKEKPI